MTTMNLRWDIDAAFALGHGPSMAYLVANDYDEQMVMRQVPGAPPTWVEVTRPATRLPVVDTHTLYVFKDHRADASATLLWHIRFRRSSDGAIYGADCLDVSAAAPGYCKIQDIRDQGFLAPAYPDVAVERGIATATDLIERICRQWFEPRFTRKRLDGRGHDRLFLDIPICTIMQGLTDSAPFVPGTDLAVANRHLTLGQLAPDDRANPMVAFGYGELSSFYERAYSFSQYGTGRQNVDLVGVFGYTELGPGDEVGEYSPQVPLSYGGTPAAIRRACMLLTIRFMQTLASGGGEEFIARGRVISESTRDQSYSLASPGGDDGSYGLTGDTEVDNLLMLFPPPLQVTTV
jgi:hypothetical protein